MNGYVELRLSLKKKTRNELIELLMDVFQPWYDESGLSREEDEEISGADLVMLVSSIREKIINPPPVIKSILPRKLGNIQKTLLIALVEHKQWAPGSGWVWSTPSQTQKVLDSLVSRGLVFKTEMEDDERSSLYKPTALGIEESKK